MTIIAPLTRSRHCCGCWPGCRRPFPPAASPIRTASNGRSRAGDITDGDTLRAWLADVLAHGAGRTDAILLRHAHRAAADPAALADIAELAAAAAPCRERQAETLDQGDAFVLAAARLGHRPTAAAMRGALSGRRRRAGRRARHRRGRRRAALSAGVHRQPDLRRGAAGAARPDPPACACWPRWNPSSCAIAAATARRDAGRSRRLRASAPTSPPCATKPSTRGCSAHDHLAQRPAARRHRRPGRHRQDRADGRAVQAPARPLRHRRHHQRHLHQGGRRVPDPRRLAAARAHPRHRDRRLPAHRDPRGRQHQPRRRRRAAAALSRRST